MRQILASHTSDFQNREYFDYAGACGGFIDKYCFPFARGRIFNTVEKDRGQYDESCKIFWASGTAFLTRTQIFKEIGVFDETLFAHMEEIDYHWKCQLGGYEVWSNPESIVYHKGGVTLAYDSPYKTFLNHRNSLIMLLTNYSLILSLVLFIPRVVLQLVSILKDLLSFRIFHALSQIRGTILAIIRIDILIKRRIEIRKIRKVKDLTLLKEVIYRGSIVWDYFIRSKKIFSKIMD